MKVLKIGFVGTRTDRQEAMADFFERVLGLRPTHSGDDMWGVPAAGRRHRRGVRTVAERAPHDRTGGGVLVDDVEAATEELRAAGIPIVFGPERADDVGLAWAHVRAPDGNIYGVIEGRDLQALA